ncbi:MAG: hypothetical protein ACRDQ0_08525 [Pseudonocardia sp.]
MTSDEPERRVAEALSARVTGAGRGSTNPPWRAAASRSGTSARTALLIALLGGAVLGTVLALVSLLAPGVLPPLG